MMSCFAFMMNSVNISLPKSIFFTIYSVKGWNLYVLLLWVESFSHGCLSVSKLLSHSSNIFSSCMVRPITDVPRGFYGLCSKPVWWSNKYFWGAFGHYIFMFSGVISLKLSLLPLAIFRRICLCSALKYIFDLLSTFETAYFNYLPSLVSSFSSSIFFLLSSYFKLSFSFHSFNFFWPSLNLC